MIATSSSSVDAGEDSCVDHCSERCKVLAFEGSLSRVNEHVDDVQKLCLEMRFFPSGGHLVLRTRFCE